MKKTRLLSLLMALALLLSVVVLTACSEDEESSEDSGIVSDEESIIPEEINLSEKFSGTFLSVCSVFANYGNTLGLTPEMPVVPEEKVRNIKLDLTLKELLMGSVPQTPGSSGLSAEFFNNKEGGKGVFSAFIGEERIPGDFYIGSDDIFVTLENLTPAPLRIPFMGAIDTFDLMENLIDFDTGDMSDTLQEYIDLFMDHFDEELFSGKVEDLVIDEAAYTNALHISFKPTEKQLLEAVLTVLNKAKKDAKIKMILSNLSFADKDKEEKQKEFEQDIEEAIKNINDRLAENKENSYLDFSAVEKDGKLISLFAIYYEDGKEEGLFRLTNVNKDGTDFLEVFYKVNEESSSFAWEQTPNDKESADGRIRIETEEEDKTQIIEIDYIGSKDAKGVLIVKSNFKITQLIESYEMAYSFSLELSYTADGVAGFGLTGELLVDNEEMRLLLEVAVNVSLIDYREVELPDPETTIPVDENFEVFGILQLMQQEYPVFYQYLSGVLGLPENEDPDLEFVED